MKSLDGMTNEELWQLFPIILSEYQDSWREDYKAESKNLESYIGVNNIVRINHIGSTAVPGLLAKPTIDILVEINNNSNLGELVRSMESAGYIYSPQPNNPAPHMMFMKGYTPEGFKPPVFHIHVRYPGDWDEIYFRDYLRLHPEAVKEYGELKLRLKEKFEHDRDGYTAAKTGFIIRIVNLAKHK